VERSIVETVLYSVSVPVNALSKPSNAFASTALSPLRDAVIIGYIANEAVSIIENARLMGVPIPQIIKNAISILKRKAETESDNT
jgi:toxin secretion/phage lysis holin